MNSSQSFGRHRGKDDLYREQPPATENGDWGLQNTRYVWPTPLVLRRREGLIKHGFEFL
jgi:hypothetical protein